MTKQEILSTPYGEMMDMISCLLIYEGKAKPKTQPKKWKFEDVMNLR